MPKTKFRNFNDHPLGAAGSIYAAHSKYSNKLFSVANESWVSMTAVGCVWQQWGGCGSNGWLRLLVRISQVDVGAKVVDVDVVEESRLFE